MTNQRNFGIMFPENRLLSQNNSSRLQKEHGLLFFKGGEYYA